MFYRQVTAYVGSRPNVEFLSPRRINRSGWSMVEAELRAMRVLVYSNEESKYFINLSGQDYPIKSTVAIKATLTTEWSRNFVEVIQFRKMAELDPHDPHLKRRLAFEMFGSLVSIRQSFVTVCG
jgi:hypothetical protein